MNNINAIMWTGVNSHKSYMDKHGEIKIKFPWNTNPIKNKYNNTCVNFLDLAT